MAMHTPNSRLQLHGSYCSGWRHLKPRARAVRERRRSAKGASKVFVPSTNLTGQHTTLQLTNQHTQLKLTAQRTHLKPEKSDACSCCSCLLPLRSKCSISCTLAPLMLRARAGRGPRGGQWVGEGGEACGLTLEAFSRWTFQHTSRMCPSRLHTGTPLSRPTHCHYPGTNTHTAKPPLGPNPLGLACPTCETGQTRGVRMHALTPGFRGPAGAVRCG